MSTLITVKNSQGVIGRCDERCYNAVTRRCKCCCGGVNHGVGLNKAITNTRRMYDEQFRANLDCDSAQTQVIRHEVYPTLF